MKRHPFIYEIPVFYTVFFGLRYLFLPDNAGFLGIDPHPFWLGILLFGFRYGVASGLTAGVVSAILFLSDIWFFGERYLFEDVTFFLLPSFFMLGGTMMGLIAERYQKKILQFMKEKEVLIKNDIALKEEIRTLKEINMGLEKRIVTRMSTLITLYEGARRLESVELEELYKSILLFICKTLGADEGAIYLKDQDGWRLKENYGWKPYHERPLTMGAGQGIIGLAGGGNKIVSIRDFIGADRQNFKDLSLVGDALVAGPLRIGEDGEVLGVMSIQNIPFVHFNSSAINLFSFLLNWASRSIGRSFYLTELRSQEVIDPEFQVYSNRYFESRARQELLRSKSYYLPLSVGLVELSGMNTLSLREKNHCLTAVAQLLKSSSRDMDVVARFPDPKIGFALLLITASPKQAEEIRGHILHHFESLKLSPKAQNLKGGEREEKTLPSVGIKIGLSHFSPRTKDVEQMITQARENLEHVFREGNKSEEPIAKGESA